MLCLGVEKVPKFKQYSVSINERTADQIRTVAQERGVSFSEGLRTLVEFGYYNYMELIGQDVIEVEDPEVEHG